MYKYTNKIRIIFFLPNFILGGAAESIVKLAEFLSKKDYSILVISIGKNLYKKKLKLFGCELIELSSSRAIFSIFKIRNIILKETLKKYSKIIFISNIHYSNLVSTLSCFKIKNIKLILTERSSLSELLIYSNFFMFIKNSLIYFFAKKLYSFSDLVITNSEFEKKYIKKYFKLKNVISIHPPSLDRINKENKLIKKNKKIKIIFVGRLSKEKGLDIIIKALAEIKNFKNYIFKIYGDGKLKNKILNLISELKLKNQIIFYGFEKNKNKIFKNADLFINASHFEGLPNAIVQALNFNVFVICSDSPGGNMEVIKNGKFGLYFKNKNHKDLAKKIKKFIHSKKNFNNKQKIRHLEKYTKKYCFNNYNKLIRKI